MNWNNIITIVSVLVLVGVEVFGVALAAGWAIGGLLELSQALTYGLMGVFSVLGLYGLWAFGRRAVLVEPLRS